MKQKRVFVTCGPSGCGKSSWIRERINKYGGYHISRDMVRFNLIEETYQPVRFYFELKSEEVTSND